MVKNALAALSIIMATVSLAYAQTTDLKACTEQERGNQTLSEKLGQTNGVICPPDIDKGMKAPTPDAGKTPVIPPPGSPGGNPNVQPIIKLPTYGCVREGSGKIIETGALRATALLVRNLPSLRCMCRFHLATILAPATGCAERCVSLSATRFRRTG